MTVTASSSPLNFRLNGHEDETGISIRGPPEIPRRELTGAKPADAQTDLPEAKQDRMENRRQ